MMLTGMALVPALWGASPEQATQHLRLVFFSDVHARAEWDTTQALDKAAAAINAQQPDVIIGGGDYITEGFQSPAAKVEPRWQAYLHMHGGLLAPVHPVIGSHDLVAARPEDGSPPAADPRAVFREKLGVSQTYGSFDAGGYHFVLLDSILVTNDGFKYHGWIGEEQMAWLQADLRRVPVDRPIVLASHFPLRSAFFSPDGAATVDGPPNRMLTNSRAVLALFARHKLLLVLQGHLHVQEHFVWQGITFLTGGAVCGQWWRGPYRGTPEGFWVIDLRGERMDARYLGYGWTARRPRHE